MPSVRARSESAGFIGSTVAFIGITDRQTYKNLLYIALALPLGFVYSVYVSFGFLFGFVLSVVLVGFAVLIGTVLGARLIATFERWLANVLLDVDIEPFNDVDASNRGLWSTVRTYLHAASTWRSLGFLSLKFWFILVAIVLVLLLSAVVSLLLAPLRYPTDIEFGTVNDEPVVWTVETLPEAGVALLAGLVLAAVLLALSNGFAYVAGRMAVALLGEPTEVSSDAADTAPERNAPVPAFTRVE